MNIRSFVECVGFYYLVSSEKNGGIHIRVKIGSFNSRHIHLFLKSVCALNFDTLKESHQEQLGVRHVACPAAEFLKNYGGRT